MSKFKPLLSADEWDELNFPRDKINQFDLVVERAISRRGFLGGVLVFGSGAAAMGTGLVSSTSIAAQQAASRFEFAPVAASLAVCGGVVGHWLRGAGRLAAECNVKGALADRIAGRAANRRAAGVELAGQRPERRPRRRGVRGRRAGHSGDGRGGGGRG